MSGVSWHGMRSARAALVAGFRSALQWRIVLWWVLAIALCTTVAAAPVWSALQREFGHSPRAQSIAAGRDLMLLADGLGRIQDTLDPVLSASAVALVLTLLVSPWLSGMAIASIQARRRLRMGELLRGGLGEYGLTGRLLLWSSVPLGLALGVGVIGMSIANRGADDAILESSLTNARHLALLVAAIVFVFMHMTLEAARGALGADRTLRSVLRAWCRGVRLVMQRPFASTAVYIGTSGAGWLVALLLGWARLHVTGASIGGFVASLVLVQLAVAAIAFGRIARIGGFAALAVAAATQRQLDAARRYGFSSR